MYSEDEIKKWMRGLSEFDDNNRLVLLAAFSVLGIPASFLDVGCGTGIMVRTARALGVDAFGVDMLPLEGPFRQHDLREPLDLGRAFQIVLSVEVAEHIDAEKAGVYCDTLAHHLSPGGILVFTAAPPGQQGDGHVNCQPAEYWRRKFHRRGLTYKPDLGWRVGLAWAIAHISTHWLEANLQVFTKG